MSPCDRFNKETGDWKHIDDDLKGTAGEGKWLSKISYASGRLELRQQSSNSVVAPSLKTVLEEAQAVFEDAKSQASVRKFSDLKYQIFRL